MPRRSARSITPSKSTRRPIRLTLEQLEDRVMPTFGTGMLVVAPDAGVQPRVKVLDPLTGDVQFSFLAYQAAFHGGVRVAVGDVNGDGTPDIITGTGPGGGSHIKVFDGTNGERLPGPVGSFHAYATGRTDGVYVAAGDVNGDGYADIITGTEQGGRPRIKVFSGHDGSLLRSWLMGPLSVTTGFRVAAGDVNGDGKSDIIVGSGPGGLPRVCVFDGSNNAELYNFFAFDTTFRGGVYVAAGDVTDDGKADMIVGSGAGMAASVRVFDGKDSASVQALQPYNASFTGGVRVSAVDANLDGQVDIVTGQGPNGKRVRIFEGRTQELLAGYQPFGSSFGSGLFVGGDPFPADGDIEGIDPILTIVATTPDTIENSSTPGVFTVTRSGDTSGFTGVSISISGTATGGISGDHSLDTVLLVLFPPNATTLTINVSTIDDSLFENYETVVATIEPGTGYEVGTPDKAVVTITDDDGPPQNVPDPDAG